jgi:hypothetical protein
MACQLLCCSTPIGCVDNPALGANISFNCLSGRKSFNYFVCENPVGVFVSCPMYHVVGLASPSSTPCYNYLIPATHVPGDSVNICIGENIRYFSSKCQCQTTGNFFWGYPLVSFISIGICNTGNVNIRSSACFAQHAGAQVGQNNGDWTCYDDLIANGGASKVQFWNYGTILLGGGAGGAVGIGWCVAGSAWASGGGGAVGGWPVCSTTWGCQTCNMYSTGKAIEECRFYSPGAVGCGRGKNYGFQRAAVGYGGNGAGSLCSINCVASCIPYTTALCAVASVAEQSCGCGGLGGCYLGGATGGAALYAPVAPSVSPKVCAGVGFGWGTTCSDWVSGTGIYNGRTGKACVAAGTGGVYIGVAGGGGGPPGYPGGAGAYSFVTGVCGFGNPAYICVIPPYPGAKTWRTGTGYGTGVFINCGCVFGVI